MKGFCVVYWRDTCGGCGDPVRAFNRWFHARHVVACLVGELTYHVVSSLQMSCEGMHARQKLHKAANMFFVQK